MSNSKKIDKVSVQTAKGTIIVGVKADSNYPGIYVDFVANNADAREAVPLAMVEYESQKDQIQTLVYGDGNSEEYTCLIAHENLPDSASWFLTNSEQFMKQLSDGVYDTIQIIVCKGGAYTATRNTYDYTEYTTDALNEFAILDGYDSYDGFVEGQGEFFKEAMLSVICRECACGKASQGFANIEALNVWLTSVDEALTI